MGVNFSLRALKHPARANEQDEKKRQMPAENLPVRRNVRANTLRDSQCHAAEQSAPQRSQTSNRDCFKRENKQIGAGRRSEAGSYAHKDGG